MSSFRTFVWDPALLISQMVALQTVFYSVESACLIAYSMTGYQPAVAHIFAVQSMRFMALIQLIASVSVAFALSLLIQRTRQCLDFVCTLHIFHLIFVCIYNFSFPTQFSWWGLQIISATICTVLGEYLCMQVETREIKLQNGPSKYDL